MVPGTSPTTRFAINAAAVSFLYLLAQPSPLQAQLNAAAAGAASQPTPATTTGAGLRAPWDLAKTLDSLVANANRLRPILEQVKPKEWVAKGAPEGYSDQHKLVMGQLRSVSYVASQLSKDPEKLTTALDLFFRIESLDLNLQSFSEGTRTYHNPAIAELMEGMRAEGAAAKSGLRDYVVELAANKEQEFKIVDNEAQKCRTQQLKAPRRTAAAR